MNDEMKDYAKFFHGDVLAAKEYLMTIFLSLEGGSLVTWKEFAFTGSLIEMREQKIKQQFNQWWEDHGMYMRAGGGQYEKTFAYEAWMASAHRYGFKKALKK